VILRRLVREFAAERPARIAVLPSALQSTGKRLSNPRRLILRRFLRRALLTDIEDPAQRGEQRVGEAADERDTSPSLTALATVTGLVRNTTRAHRQQDADHATAPNRAGTPALKRKHFQTSSHTFPERLLPRDDEPAAASSQRNVLR